MAIAALIFVMLFDMGELIKGVPIETIKDASMFAMPTELLERFDACDYKYLFFCDKKPNTRNCESGRIEGPAHELNGEIPAAPPAESWWSKWLNGNAGFSFLPWAKGMLMAAATLPRLPDAFVYILQCRWRRGHLEFALGVLFVFAYITLMVVTLRRRTLANLIFFSLVVVLGPYLVGAVFWLLQHALVGAASEVTATVGFLTTTLGLPACLVICMKHDAGTLTKLVRAGVEM